MSPRRTILIAALISMAPAALVMAQTDPQTGPQTDRSSPSAASSPHQRDTTSMQTPEASSADGTSSSSTSPSAASSTHQRDTTRMASKQSMKDCIAKQKSDNSGMSTADAKKACKSQMKGNSG
jgi:hypothetical protein